MSNEIQRRVHEQIGALIVENTAVSVARDAAYRALHECIISEQVPAERVPALVASVPGFAEWRAAQA